MWTIIDVECVHFRFKVWYMKGQKKLLELLANMGYVCMCVCVCMYVCVQMYVCVCMYVCMYVCACVTHVRTCMYRLPLVQCKQKFASMDIQHRDNLKQLIDDSAHKFQLDDITFGSFVAQLGYRTQVHMHVHVHVWVQDTSTCTRICACLAGVIVPSPPPLPSPQLCASDMVYSSTALIEDTDKSHSECFLHALEALSRYMYMHLCSLHVYMHVVCVQGMHVCTCICVCMYVCRYHNACTHTHTDPISRWYTMESNWQNSRYVHNS